MKIIYTILFFSNVLLLIILFFLFLTLLDGEINKNSLTLIIAGIVLSISFLAYFLYRYNKLPPTNSNH